jgi:hypothetical protein
VAKCQKDARNGKNPVADCYPPYAGKAAECVAKAEAKAAAKTAGCKDCPECYSAGNCDAEGSSRTADTEASVDVFVPIVFCAEPALPDDLNDDEAKCMQSMAKFGGKFAAAKAKCYAKCRRNECKGTIPAGSCTAGAVTDPTNKTQECIAKQEAKCVAKIGAKCTDQPECITANPAVDPATDLCILIEAAVDAEDAQTYCGSPSGAFLE